MGIQERGHGGHDARTVRAGDEQAGDVGHGISGAWMSGAGRGDWLPPQARCRGVLHQTQGLDQCDRPVRPDSLLQGGLDFAMIMCFVPQSDGVRSSIHRTRFEASGGEGKPLPPDLVPSPAGRGGRPGGAVTAIPEMLVSVITPSRGDRPGPGPGRAQPGRGPWPGRGRGLMRPGQVQWLVGFDGVKGPASGRGHSGPVRRFSQVRQLRQPHRDR
jgi:hypothetical protein